MKKIVAATADRDQFEIVPYGVTLGFDSTRPVLLFKDKSGEKIVPVYLSPLEAGIAMSQDHIRQAGSSPHGLSFEALKTLGVKPEKCSFVELKGHHQFVEVQFSGSEGLKVLRARADQAVSFCLHAKTPFFCTYGFFESCREIPVIQSPVNTKDNRQRYLN